MGAILGKTSLGDVLFRTSHLSPEGFWHQHHPRTTASFPQNMEHGTICENQVAGVERAVCATAKTNEILSATQERRLTGDTIWLVECGDGLLLPSRFRNRKTIGKIDSRVRKCVCQCHCQRRRTQKRCHKNATIWKLAMGTAIPLLPLPDHVWTRQTISPLFLYSPRCSDSRHHRRQILTQTKLLGKLRQTGFLATSSPSRCLSKFRQLLLCSARHETS